MPPKQVYGKRFASKTTTAYAKIISPDKDDIPSGEHGRKGATRRARSRREDEAAVLEQKLDALDLRDKDEVTVEEVTVEEVEKNKNRQPLRRIRNGSDKKVKGEEVIGLTTDLGALTLCEGNQRNQPKATSATRSLREAPKTIDRVFETNKENASINASSKEQTAKMHRPAPLQTSPSTPVKGRKLKAVVIPKRPLSPKMSQLPTPNPTPEPADPYLAYVSPLLSLSYSHSIISFEDWSSALGGHFEVSKIAEASFSEVYRLSTSTRSDSANESVLKLVALRSPPNAPLRSNSQVRKSRDPERQAKKDSKAREEKDEWKSHVDDVLSEVKLLQNLNHIPGFTTFRQLTILQGRPSSTFIEAWKAWNKARSRGKKSEFPDPSRKASYDDTQLWAVIEMQDAGTDCEKFMDLGGMNTIWEIWDVFWGVCISVAKAEDTCKFEHRDLHLENICIRSSRSQSDNDLAHPIIQDPLRRKLGFTDLETTVIDYTLSRADILPTSSSRRSSFTPSLSDTSSSTDSTSSKVSSEPEVAYLDLDRDMGLFEGDATEEYQYEIYRYMRGIAFHSDPTKSSLNAPSLPDTPRRSPRKTAQHIIFDDDEAIPRRSPRKTLTNKPCDPPSNVWKHFHPKTNLIWTHFILHKLLLRLEDCKPANLSKKEIMRNVEARLEESGRVVSKANKLYKILESVAALLEPDVLATKGSLTSVKELVILAMEERWLRAEDVAG